MNAQVDGTGSDSSPGAASADFAAGIDSPVSTASSHSNRVASSSRMSAGTTFPMPRVTMSPGTSSRTSTRRSVPSRRASVKWRMLSCKATAARSERYSLTKPSPTLSARIALMITASAGSPVSPEIRAAPSSRNNSGFRSCRLSTPSAVTRWVSSTFAPNVRRRSAASAELSPSEPVPSRSSTASAGNRLAEAASSGASDADGAWAAFTAKVSAALPSLGSRPRQASAAPPRRPRDQTPWSRAGSGSRPPGRGTPGRRHG